MTPVEIQAVAELFFTYVASVGLVSRHTTLEMTGLVAATLYSQVMRNLPDFIREAIEKAERQEEPVFVAGIRGIEREGKTAALEVVELLYAGGGWPSILKP